MEPIERSVMRSLVEQANLVSEDLSGGSLGDVVFKKANNPRRHAMGRGNKGSEAQYALSVHGEADSLIGWIIPTMRGANLRSWTLPSTTGFDVHGRSPMGEPLRHFPTDLGYASPALDAAKSWAASNLKSTKVPKAGLLPRPMEETEEDGEAVSEAMGASEALKAMGTHFKSYTAAVAAARKMAEDRGYQIDEDSWDTRVTHGYPARPAEGKTTSLKIGLLKGGKPVRNMLVISVYGMRTGFELTAYIS